MSAFDYMLLTSRGVQINGDDLETGATSPNSSVNTQVRYNGAIKAPERYNVKAAHQRLDRAIAADERFKFEVEFRVSLIHDFACRKSCPFCSSRLVVSDCSFNGLAFLKSCKNCAYWEFDYHELPNYEELTKLLASTSSTEKFLLAKFKGGELNTHGMLSKMREFDLRVPEICVNETAQIIRRKREIWQTIDPLLLEKLVADVFKANYAPCEVMHVGRPGDGGVDVVFVDSGNTQWLIQVKRREKSDASEGVNTIRNLLGAMIIHGTFNGIVVSTADHFTFNAYQAIGRAREVGMKLRLIDRGKLDRMLDPLLPDQPWKHALQTLMPKQISEYFLKHHL